MYQLGIDIGGTYTDLVLIDTASGRSWMEKTLTTPHAPFEGVVRGMATVLRSAGVQGIDLARVVHGTTLVINAIIERKGCRAALLTTEGFGDILEMRRGRRFDMDDLQIEVPDPLVPRDWVGEVPERMKHDGTPERVLDSAGTERAVLRLKEAGVQAIAVCLLHAYVNPSHESAVKALAARAAPGLPISLSSEVAPDIREYERASTTVANAYALPLFQEYIDRFERGLSDAGYKRGLLMMTSDGGLFEARHARQLPVRFIESGPAGGCCAARHAACRLGRKDLVAFDMGGTTAKISLVSREGLALTNEIEVARRYRFKKGSGLPMRIPSVEMLEIGAGGGSIARINELGLLQVGPESAGAVPGPACYGRGGTAMTVTDANLLLGYFGERSVLGGGLELDREAARSAASSLGRSLTLNSVRVAWGVHELVSQEMANAARLHLLELGVDPRSQSMLAFGGAGPQHACRVARKLGVRTVIVPEAAGVLSAYGFLVAPVAATLVRGWPGRLRNLDPAAIDDLLGDLERDARALAANAAQGLSVECRYFASLRYVGQGKELRLAVPRHAVEGFAALEAEFHAEYRRLNGRSNPAIEVEAMNWGVTITSTDARVGMHVLVEEAPRGEAEVVSAYFEEASGYVDCPLVSRRNVTQRPMGGPVLVRDRGTTTVVPPRSTVQTDEDRNLVVQLH